MTSLPELVLLVACGASMVSAQNSEQPRRMTKPLVQYTTLTCKVPPGYRERNIYQLGIFRQTESGFLRSLVNKSRDEIFQDFVVGDIPTLSSATGRVIENDASSSFLNFSFVLDDCTYGLYKCMITFAYIRENKKETESTNIFLGEPSTIKENISSSGFSGYFTPAFRNQWTWSLHNLSLQQLELKENRLQNSETKDSQHCSIICRLGEAKPNCLHVHSDVLAHNLSYLYDTSKNEHIITMDVCIINGSRCPSVKYTATVETKEGPKVVEALVFLNSNTDPSEKVIGTESNIIENTTTHNNILKGPDSLLIALIVVSSLFLLCCCCCCCFIAWCIIRKRRRLYSRVPIQQVSESMGLLSSDPEVSNRQEQSSNQVVSNGQGQPSGQAVSNGQEQSSNQVVSNGQGQPSGQAVSNGQEQSSNQVVSNGQGQPSGQAVSNGQVQSTNQAVSNGLGQPSGQMVNNGQGQSSDPAMFNGQGQSSNQSVSNGQGQPSGQTMSNDQGQPSGQTMSDSQGQSSNEVVSNHQGQFAVQTASNGQGRTSDQLASNKNIEGGSGGQERVEYSSSEGNDRSSSVEKASESMNDIKVSTRDLGTVTF